MSVDLTDGLAHIKNHPAKFRFEGLGHKFFQTANEAALADERYMDRYVQDMFDSETKEFDQAVAEHKDADELLSRFCEFAGNRVTARKWHDLGLPFCTDWTAAPLSDIMTVVTAFADQYRDDYIRDWRIGDTDFVADMIRDDEELVRDHPPEAMWCNASDTEVLLEDVFFTCPSCSEPQTEKDLVDFRGEHNGYPNFYCGSCGSEMNAGRHEDIRDFFVALNVTPYPFNAAKRAEWQTTLAARAAWGENKLELTVGEQVYLKDLASKHGRPRILSTDRGKLVTITHVTNTTTCVDGDTSYAGLLVEAAGFVDFHHVHSRYTE